MVMAKAVRMMQSGDGGDPGPVPLERFEALAELVVRPD